MPTRNRNFLRMLCRSASWPSRYSPSFVARRRLGVRDRSGGCGGSHGAARVADRPPPRSEGTARPRRRVHVAVLRRSGVHRRRRRPAVKDARARRRRCTPGGSRRRRRGRSRSAYGNSRGRHQPRPKPLLSLPEAAPEAAPAAPESDRSAAESAPAAEAAPRQTSVVTRQLRRRSRAQSSLSTPPAKSVASSHAAPSAVAAPKAQAAKPAPAKAKAPATKKWVLKRAAAAPAPAPEIEHAHESGFGEPTVWLNRALPDPTPASARLTRAFAHQLVAVSKQSRRGLGRRPRRPPRAGRARIRSRLGHGARHDRNPAGQPEGLARCARTLGSHRLRRQRRGAGRPVPGGRDRDARHRLRGIEGPAREACTRRRQRVDLRWRPR